ncbi:MAG: gamma-glutamyl-gamma-aminobutyrate hydrolase family protein [Bacteriovoracaceae bacterium]|nr:gamma-glutamyl-gamma-aminobutyrate hydrolase family protein [Bacteriovoracaceae bacterium]
MIRFLFLLAFLLLFPTFAFSETVTIGCATKCDFFFKYALKKVGKIKGVSVSMVDISSRGTSIKWEDYDGVIFPGGADIDPKYYLSAVETDLQKYTLSLDHLVNYSSEGKRRDPIEFNLLKDYFSRPELSNLPVLGVCRGMQMLAVSQGIPLYVDIKAELAIRNRRYLYDRIIPEQGDTIINQLFNAPFKGFERHHQGIRVSYFNDHIERWPHLKITSFSNKGRIAESLEFSNRPVLGVQFHPENDFGYERNRIFGWLIDSALRRKKLLDQ